MGKITGKSENRDDNSASVGTCLDDDDLSIEEYWPWSHLERNMGAANGTSPEKILWIFTAEDFMTDVEMQITSDRQAAWWGQ